jgi:hypothetical protein
MGTDVVVGAYSYYSGNWGHCWIAMTLDNNIVTMTLDTIFAFIIRFK